MGFLKDLGAFLGIIGILLLFVIIGVIGYAFSVTVGLAALGFVFFLGIVALVLSIFDSSDE